MQPVSRVAAFESCGTGAYLVRHRHDHDRYKVVGGACHDRFCVPCQVERSRVIATNVIDYLGARPVRFVTLTLRHSDAPLAEQLDRLQRCFQALRRRRVWREHVYGGVAFLELTVGRDGRWHPHYHVLVQGTYLPHLELKRAWHDVTGDSHVVDIRMARGNTDVVRYVAKYASKPFVAEAFDDLQRGAELVEAMRSRKTVIAFGSWRTLKTTGHAVETEWEYVCTLHELVERARFERGYWLHVLQQVSRGHADELFAAVPASPRPPPSLAAGQATPTQARLWPTAPLAF